MSETQTFTPHTPDRFRPVEIDGVAPHLQPTEIEDLRHRQQIATLNETRQLPGLETISDDRRAEINDRIVREHLAAAGMTEGDEHYQEAYDYLRSVSADNITHHDWYVPEEDELGTYKTPPRSIQAFDRLNREYRWGTANNALAPTDPVNPTDPDDTAVLRDADGTIIMTPEQQRNLNIDSLAKAKHEAFAAKVNGPAFGKGKEELWDNYEAAEKAYISALRDQIQAEITAQGYDAAQMRDYITKVVNERLQFDATAQKEEVIKAGGVKGKLLAKYANLSTGKKILATVGIGAIGGGAGLALGAAGAGAALTVATIAGIRYGRAYAMRLSKIYKDDAKITAYDGAGIEDADLERNALEYLYDASLEKVKKAERIKKRAVFTAMGAVAVGGALGAVSHVVVDHVTDYVEDNSHWVAGYAQHGYDYARNHNWLGAHNDAPTTSSGNSGGLDTHPGSADPTTPTAEQPTPPKAKEWHFDGDERQIQSGEGWNQTLREIGVSSSHRAELLKEIGPKLEDKGLAYWDKGAHEWRMNMTDDGKLPKSAIKLIAEHAHEHGWHTNYDQYFDAAGGGGVDTSSVTTGSSEHLDFSDSAQHIDKGEGFYQTIREMGVSADNQADVLDRAAPDLLKLDDVAYEMPDGNPGILMNTDHELSDKALNILHDAAVETGASDNVSITHDGVEFDGLSDNGSGDAIPMHEFVVSDAVKNYDADANAYYDVLKGTDRSHWKTILNEAAPQLQRINNDGLSLAYRGADGWHFREIGKLPRSARDILNNVAERHDWTLARLTSRIYRLGVAIVGKLY